MIIIKLKKKKKLSIQTYDFTDEETSRGMNGSFPGTYLSLVPNHLSQEVSCWMLAWNQFLSALSSEKKTLERREEGREGGTPLLSFLLNFTLLGHPEKSLAGREEIQSNPLLLQIKKQRPREKKGLCSGHTGRPEPNSGILEWGGHCIILCMIQSSVTAFALCLGTYEVSVLK